MNRSIYRVWYRKQIKSNNGENHIVTDCMDIMAKTAQEAEQKIEKKGYTVIDCKETY